MWTESAKTLEFKLRLALPSLRVEEPAVELITARSSVWIASSDTMWSKTSQGRKNQVNGKIVSALQAVSSRPCQPSPIKPKQVKIPLCYLNNIIGNNFDTGATLLVRKDFEFEEVIIDSLLTSLQQANNRDGVTLFKWMHNQLPLNQLKMILTDTPTWLTSQSFLDYFQLSEKTRHFFKVQLCKTMSGMCDHFPVQLKLPFSSQLQTRLLKTIRSFVHTNWNKFKFDLASMLSLKKTAYNLTEWEMDEATILATDIINIATRKNTKLIKKAHEIMMHLKVRELCRRNLKLP